CSKRDLIRSDGRSTEVRNNAFFNRCMDESRKIEHAALGRLAQESLSRKSAFRRRSRKENRPQSPAQALDVCRLLSSIDGGYLARHRIQSDLLREGSGAIFSRKPFAREQSRAKKSADRMGV